MTKRVHIFTPNASGPPDHHQHLMAMYDGINLDPDVHVTFSHLQHGYTDCDIAVLFGVGKKMVPASFARGEVYREHHTIRGKDVIIIERGFIDRERYYGAAWNGLNGLADFVNQNSLNDRWNSLGVTIDPWRLPNPENHILLCGQVPWDASVQHIDYELWVQETYHKLVAIGKDLNRKVIFRPHPQVQNHDYGVPSSKRTWEEDLKNTHCVIAYNSTSAALAILGGVPIFAFHKGSMAWEVACHTLNHTNLVNPPKPARFQWACNLAYAQWTEDEMRKGLTWQHLKRKFK